MGWLFFGVGVETSPGGLASCSLPTVLLQSFLNPFFFFVFKLYLHLDTLLKTLLTWETAETPPAVPADGFYTLFSWEKKVIFGVMLDPKHSSTLRYFTQAWFQALVKPPTPWCHIFHLVPK